MKNERLIRDVTMEYEQMRAQLLLIRVTLGLNPCHDPVTAVRTLYEEGRDAFHKQRGDKCGWAHEWQPPVSYAPWAVPVPSSTRN